MKKILSILLVFLLFTLSSCQSSCQEEKRFFQKTLLGAEFSLYVNEVRDDCEISSIRYRISTLAKELDDIFSLQKEGEVSLYNALNEGESIEIGDRFKAVLTYAKELNEKTDGAYDPSVKHLVDLWGFSYRHGETNYEKTLPYDRERLENGAYELPDNRYIDGFLSISSLDHLTVKEENEKTFLEKSPHSFVSIYEHKYTHAIDLAGLVKGYFCDEVKKALDNHGIKNYYFTVGGSSLYLGEKFEGAWDLSIVDPFKEGRQTYGTVKVKNSFVSASGVYENNYSLNGKVYSHIIDPKTGKPTESDLASATVIAQSGIYTDGLATALVVMGKEKALEFLNGEEGVEYVLFAVDGQVYTNVKGGITVNEN